MKKRCFSALLSALILISASRVVACGSCVSIHMDRLLPPITGWVVLSLGWSFLLSIYSAITATDIWGVPRPLGWLVLVAIFSLAGLLFVGPLFLLFLMLPGIVLTIRVVFPAQSFTTGQKRDLRVISAVGVACLVGLIIASETIRRERTDADFILTYENSGPARTTLQGLVDREPAPLSALREIVRRGTTGPVVAMASEGVAAHGEPVRDVPLLIDAYTRLYGKAEEEKIAGALAKLSGFSLPKGSPPVAWMDGWALHMQEKRWRNPKGSAAGEKDQ